MLISYKVQYNLSFRINEAGIFNHWIWVHTGRKMPHSWESPQDFSPKVEAHPLQLNHLYTSMLLFIFVASLAMLAFIGELIYGHMSRTNNAARLTLPTTIMNTSQLHQYSHDSKTQYF